MLQLRLLIGNSNLLSATLTNKRTGVAISGAQVRATLRDAAGQELVGQGWPLDLADQLDGTYIGVLSQELELEENQRVEAEVTATKSGNQAQVRKRLRAEVDRS